MNRYFVIPLLNVCPMTGQVLNRNASIDTPAHLYNGKPRDPMTGMVNYGFRDYNPRQGRFTTVDPIRDGTNWYGYVVNDPLNLIDRYGLETEDSAGRGGNRKPTIRTNPIVGADIAIVVALGFEFGNYTESDGDRGRYLKLGAGVGVEAGVKVPFLSKIGDFAGEVVGNAAGRLLGQAADRVVNSFIGTQLQRLGVAIAERNVSLDTIDDLRGSGQEHRVHVIAGTKQDGETGDTQLSLSPSVGGAVMWTYTFGWPRMRN